MMRPVEDDLKDVVVHHISTSYQPLPVGALKA
jgi:hypothetical protein